VSGEGLLVDFQDAATGETLLMCAAKLGHAACMPVRLSR
jgi:hypothetical protein